MLKKRNLEGGSRDENHCHGENCCMEAEQLNSETEERTSTK